MGHTAQFHEKFNQGELGTGRHELGRHDVLDEDCRGIVLKTSFLQILVAEQLTEALHRPLGLGELLDFVAFVLAHCLRARKYFQKRDSLKIKVPP